MPRCFNNSQRVALYDAAGGVCVLCGLPLVEGWNADHVKPFAVGGETTLTNGQALCPTCNKKKGSDLNMSLSGLPEWGYDLRDWQELAFMKWQERSPERFLVVATPGAGKTRLALRIAHYLLSAGLIRRVVIVCPSTHLKRQWARDAVLYGIHLDYTWDNGRENAESKDYHGICVTYAQVGQNPQQHKRFTSRIPTMVIFDEVHHAGESMSWGDGVRDGYTGATFKLLLSGTPFRSDNNPIPFVTYADNKSVADFSYGYGDALRDSVCRRVVFPHYEGTMEWMSGFDVVRARFSDAVRDNQANERLRVAISPEGQWISGILKDAASTLCKVRQSHADAGGLVVCDDQTHARKVARILERLTGEYPTVAISDDPNASANIEAFGRDTSQWIVAVRMVSEGVDIRRLRVLVYATCITTELYFRQFTGRAVRVISDMDADQTSYVFIPSDDRLKLFAQQIKEERDHQLEQDILSDPKEQSEKEPVEKKTKDEGPRFVVPIEVGNAVHAGSLSQDGEFSAAEIQHAGMVRSKLAIHVEDHLIALILREGAPHQPPAPEPPRTTYTVENSVKPKPETLTHDRVKALSKQVAKQVWYVVALKGEKSDPDSYKRVGYELRENTDGRLEQKDCTLSELQKRYEYMDQWIKRLKKA